MVVPLSMSLNIFLVWQFLFPSESFNRVPKPKGTTLGIPDTVTVRLEGGGGGGGGRLGASQVGSSRSKL